MEVEAKPISLPVDGDVDVEEGEVVEEPADSHAGRVPSGENLEDGEVSEEEGEQKEEEGAEKSESAKKDGPPRRSNRICPYFLQGRCYKGNNCPMIHSTEPANAQMNMSRGPMHPAAAMMMMAAMRGGSGGPFLRPPLLPGANIPGAAMPPLLQAPRFPFPFPVKQASQNEPESGGQYAVNPMIPGETDQENNEKPESDAQAGGVNSAWELGLKRAKELKKQAELRRKLASEMPPGKTLEKTSTETSAWSASDVACKIETGKNGDATKKAAAKRDSTGQERKAFRMNQDGEGGIVDPWRRGAAGGAVPGPHKSRERNRRPSKSGSESASGSSYSSRSYSTGSSYSRSRSGSSASGSSATGSSYSGSGSASGSYSGSRSGSTGSSYSSYSGSSYSGSSRSRSRSPARRGQKKGGKGQQQQKKKPQIPPKSRAQGPAAGKLQSPSKAGASKAAASKPASKVPSSKPAAVPKPSQPAAAAKPAQPTATQQAKPAQGPVKPAPQPAAASKPAAAPAPSQSVKRSAAAADAGGVAAAAAPPAAKAAKLSKDDIMRQIAKLDAAIAKKRTSKK